MIDDMKQPFYDMFFGFDVAQQVLSAPNCYFCRCFLKMQQSFYHQKNMKL